MSPAFKKRRILILAAFFDSRPIWIDDFCNRHDFDFHKEPFIGALRSWHSRGATTPAGDWLAQLNYARRAIKNDRWDCVITCFPQLAFIAAALLLISNNSATRLVAWNFNLGSLPGGWKRHLAKGILKRVDRFIVHSIGEISTYAQWLGVNPAKLRFVPLQRANVEKPGDTPIKRPYIVSMGSANRDYPTLLDAVRGTGITTVIISKKTIIDALPENPTIIKMHSLSVDECNDILGGAEINVVPISSTQTAAGQVTFTTSMRMGIATVASRCVGTVDYIRDWETGVLVPISDSLALNKAIVTLWHDNALRSRIALAGRDYAEANFSDEAAARSLAQNIDELLSNTAGSSAQD